MTDENMEPEQEAPTANRRKRIGFGYDADTGKILVSGGEVSEVPILELSGMPHEKLKYLAFLGVRSHINYVLSRSKTSGASVEERLDAAKDVADRIDGATVESLVGPGPGNWSRGPKKQDRIAALASLKGHTITAMTEALKRLPDERVKELLHSAEVEAYLNKLEQPDAA